MNPTYIVLLPSLSVCQFSDWQQALDQARAFYGTVYHSNDSARTCNALKTIRENSIAFSADKASRKTRAEYIKWKTAKATA
jgi:hypothetical protein